MVNSVLRELMIKVKPCLDTPGSKLGLYLGEPDFMICRPEGWQLHAGCGNGWSSSRRSRFFSHLGSCDQLMLRSSMSYTMMI